MDGTEIQGTLLQAHMLAYAIGVCFHPRLAACIEKEHTLTNATAYASCIEKEKEHTLAYAHAHAYASMRVWPHALRKTRIVTATHRHRIMLSMQQSCNRAATELQQ